MSGSNRVARLIDVVCLVVIVVAGATLLSRRDTHGHDTFEAVTELAPGTTVALDGLPTLGSEAAPVVVLEFSDYHCPYCIRYARTTFPAIRDTLIKAGRVRYAYAHSPLPQLHPLAPQLSRAAICAGQQGLFWQAHERLFGAGKDDEPSADAVLSNIGLNQAAQAACLNDTWVDTILGRDLDTAERLGITGTPQFLVGRRVDAGGIQWLRRIKGSQELSVMARVVDEVAATTLARR